MPFSHHSHSGQFCSHAKNTLEEMVLTAIEKKFTVLALTEHMPREEADLYPEEIEASVSETSLAALFDAYHQEALRLQEAYASKIKVLIGTETEWIRPSSQGLIESLFNKYSFDIFVGSVHHVHTIPIDYDSTMYQRARRLSGGTDEKLFEDYFDAQHQMLQALKPPVVGHFDLIRLKSDNPEASFRQWGTVWHKILRNLDFIVSYGGVLELNSAALRKDMTEPYPKAEICREFMARRGWFTFSDDSHGLDHVATNYDGLVQFVVNLGISEIHYFEKGSNTSDDRSRGISTRAISLATLQEVWPLSLQLQARVENLQH